MKNKKQLKTFSDTPKSGGLVIGYEKLKGKENIYYISDDCHSIILGATRSGKTRSFILQSICLLALAGESLFVSDVKGELYDYTSNFLKRLNYEVVVIDFKNPLKSHKYNLLQPIIDYFYKGLIAEGIDAIWDLTRILVPERNGERIWEEGETSILAGAITSVVWDNMNNPEFQNLTNVYAFINNMCIAEGKGDIPLNKYIKKLDDTHPAKQLFGVARIAPEKTRGSFFTSALATLRLFTSPYIYNMTCKSDFNMAETGTRKTAVFIILPDEKSTYNTIATLVLEQQYQFLVKCSDEHGGRLPIRVTYVLDEFGNFSKLNNMSNKVSVGAGRGIRFNLVIQSFSQLEEKYGKELSQSIKDNMHCMIYLNSENPATNKEISDRLGTYTTSSYGQSNSTSRNSNSSSSMNLISRPLLMPAEVKKIDRPYVLIMMKGCDPVILKMPDISQWKFNTMLGMGDEDYNKKLRIFRQGMRKKYKEKPIALWGIWNKYTSEDFGSLEIPQEFPEVENYYEEDFTEKHNEAIEEVRKSMYKRINDFTEFD